MTIPPFPSQDLAKLVLGYLVEEQLMTAYDEFLNESPYLDAQKNEYDRIIMHSLRNILAEYRAVRIYVETCKPIALRKKLFQCTNLLEIVKYLIRHIDVNKLQADAINERVSFDSQDVTTSKIGCDACSCLRLGSCMCTNRKRKASSSKSIYNTESTDAVESVAQTTSLSDLPGNQDPMENRHVKVLERQTIKSTSSSGESHEVLAIASPSISNVNVEQSSILPSSQIQANPNNIMPTTTTNKTNALNPSLDCSQNIAEFNSVLKEVYNNSVVTGNIRDNSLTENIINSRISTTGTFEEFTTGVGGLSKTNVSVPDSSTSENINVQVPPTTYKENKTQNKRNVKVQQRKKCSFRIGNVKHDVTEISSEVIDVDSVDLLPKPKPEEQKVTILSDVRVGNDDRLVRLAPVLQNATSTPLLQMQTIFINGTPVYKPKPPEQNFTFTRDEIMAMPTIIIVPSSGESQSVASMQPQPIMAQSSSITTPTCTMASSILPITVDVSSSSTNVTSVHNVPSQTVQITDGKVGLVKTVEAIKNASVPKDCIVASSCSTSTPQMLPPKRKSSSTPRRTSHVRVLDFTTPRRILNDTINEDHNLEGDPNNPDEVTINKSSNVAIPQGSNVGNSFNVKPNIEVNNTDSNIVNLIEENKSDQKKTVIRKNNNWDADLRALAVASGTVEKSVLPPIPKPKQKQTKKDAEDKGPGKKKNESNVDVTRKKNSIKNNTTPNIRTSKKKGKQSDAKDKKLANNMPSPDFPAIVCASANEKEITAVKEPDKGQNKSNDGQRIDTPEVERLSLQNEIGVKLNISDILETPYKQALYDIQMETPRFLGPDLPDDPMSDIKIMNIPTPRFLTTNTPFTPKPSQPTPSSYSSRPTDYSSGGSYYKPDDQEYLPILEDMGCPMTSTLSKDNSKSTSEKDNNLKENQPKEKPKRNKSSRPIRQCTKNVSYTNVYKSPMINKNNDTDKKGHISSYSDSISANSSFENIPTESKVTPRGIKIKLSTKSGLTKNRSPLKKSTQKSFMKIKPRRPTPAKEVGKKSKRSSEINNPRVNQRNRSTSREKVASVSTLVLPVPTKSRRKSSTPRKLHCTKTFNSESSGHDSPEGDNKENTEKIIPNTSVTCVQDSDTEQQPLRWSDDGSQDSKVYANISVPASNDIDEISQIKDYIDKTYSQSTSIHKDKEGSLHIDLIKRGFDEETAKIIERDLLNTNQPSSQLEKNSVLQLCMDETTTNNKVLERSIESDCSTLTNNLIIQEDVNEEEEFSVHECNKDTSNYIVAQYDDSKKPTKCEISKLKDKFSMEVCIDDGVVVRLRTTTVNYLFEQDPQELNTLLATNRETEIAVSSISNIDRLYTPLKESIRDQCYEIFDSTLTSIDTPLKSDSPKRKQDCTLSENVLSEDKHESEIIEINDSRKRKRSHGSSASEESVNQTKKVKDMLNSKEIKDLDIETVLSRLHGP